jgi:hypothetical protein
MSGYIGTQPVPQATQTRDAFTATSGQTSFATSGYTPSFLDVYLNGIKLAAADYTASNGSDVVLASGAATGDILEVVAYTSFEVVTDTVTNAGTVLNLDRTGSDGTILDLKKDGYTVGGIGVGQSDDLYIGTDDTGILTASNDAICPWNPSTNAGRDNAIDLGTDALRFKDLYLSGGVYLGGTGSANKLDDYEEGTFTPTITGDISAPTLGYVRQDGYYTKVGNIVHCNMYVQTSSRTGGSGGLRILGLPFVSTNVSSIEFYGNVLGYYISSGRTQLDCNTFPNTSQLAILGGGNNTDWAPVPITGWGTGTTAVRISVTYRAS